MRRLMLAAALLVACTSGSPPHETGAVPLVGVADSLRRERPDTITLIVAATTDVHGWLRGWDYYGNREDTTRGLARAITIVDSLRAAHDGRVILLDAGDLLQGSPLTTLTVRDSTLRDPVIAAMNAAGYDAAAIGNHEFNYGLAHLHRAIAQARFPFLAANVYDASGRQPYVPWTMLRRGGARVAIVGGTTPGSMIWDRDKLTGRIVVRDIVPAVRDAVGDARAAGADAVVVVLHAGLTGASSYDTVSTGLPGENVSARVAHEVPGIDLLIFGHSHRELSDSIINGVLVQQPRASAASVSVAELRLTRDADGYRVTRKRGEVLRSAGRAEARSVVSAVQSAHDLGVAMVTTPIGTTPAAWRADSARVRDTPIIDLVLEVQRRVAGADLASAAAFNLNAEFGPGPITMADMAELYPYDNNVLRAVRISGRQLREYLEFSARYYREGGRGDSLVDRSVPGFNFDIVAGVDYAIDITRPIGQRIVRLHRAGRPVADTDTFTLALNDYRQSGGGGYTMLRGAPVVYDQQQVIRDLLIEEVRRAGVLRPGDYFNRNWRLLPDTLVGAAWRSMRRLPFDRPRTP